MELRRGYHQLLDDGAGAHELLLLEGEHRLVALLIVRIRRARVYVFG